MENEKKNTPIKKTALKTVKKKKGGSFSKMSKKRKQRYIRRGILGGLGIIVVVVIAMVLNMVYSIIQDTAAFDPDKILRYQPFTLLDSNDKAFYTYGVEPVDFEEILKAEVFQVVLPPSPNRQSRRIITLTKNKLTRVKSVKSS